METINAIIDGQKNDHIDGLAGKTGLRQGYDNLSNRKKDRGTKKKSAQKGKQNKFEIHQIQFFKE